jgi:hypothetical protein
LFGDSMLISTLENKAFHLNKNKWGLEWSLVLECPLAFLRLWIHSPAPPKVEKNKEYLVRHSVAFYNPSPQDIG